MSQDKVLLGLIRDGKDVHSMTGTSMWNMSHGKDEQVTYDYFEYCRKMTEHFQDADGNLVDEKFSLENVSALYQAGKIKSTDERVLRKDAELGVQFEYIRKMAKVVNFGRRPELCRSKTLLKTVKPTAMSRGHAKVIPCRSAA